MPRTSRQIEAGMIYHVLNVGTGGGRCFRPTRTSSRSSSFWGRGLLVRPRTDPALPGLMGWVTVTHARRHHRHYPNPGTGHLYQGRFKSFPVQTDEHFLTVARYVHANPLRAGLVDRPEHWRWSDVGSRRSHGELPMAAWPVDRPRNWTRRVSEPLGEAEAAAVETSLRRGTPFGSIEWVKRTAAKLDLASTLRPRGRPPKPPASLSPRYRKQLERGKGDKST